jgi:hypothetical protein
MGLSREKQDEWEPYHRSLSHHFLCLAYDATGLRLVKLKFTVKYVNMLYFYLQYVNILNVYHFITFLFYIV